MRSRPGFTLVDLMVALTVLALVLAAVYAVFVSQQKTAAAAEESRDVYGQGLMIMDRLTRDLTGAWLPPNNYPGAMRYEFSADDLTLNLSTTASLSPDALPVSEIVEVGYRLEPGAGPDGDRYIFYRRQDDTPDSSPDEGGNEIELTRDLVSLKLEYESGDGEAVTTWIARIGSELPKAIRIELVLAAEDGAEETFTGLAAPQLSQPAIMPVSTGFNLGNLF